MKLKVLLPTKVLVDEPVTKVTGEDGAGSFTLLPRHIDYATALPPSLLSFVTEAGEEVFLAVDEGILVKRGDQVMVSVQNATRGTDLGQLFQLIEEEFHTLDEHESRARSAALHLESDLVRQFIELRERG
jgi:F-type H+-transporting ATPase subunit epsilon